MKKKCKHIKIGKRFFLKRLVDDSKVSGIGLVAFGVLMPSGKVVLEWLTEHVSEAIYESLDHCMEIHGHNGHTVVELVDNVDTWVIH